MKAVRLKCCGKETPLDLHKEQIFFQWQCTCPHNGSSQSAFEIQVFEGEQKIWDTGRRESGECTYISYEGQGLAAGARYTWRVRLWDENENPGDWSETASFETGLGPKDWKGEWIGLDDRGMPPFDPSAVFYCADDFVKGENHYYLPPAPILRKEIRVREGLCSAKAYVSALGLAELLVNGKRAGDDWFLPGLSDYPKRVFYRTYHVEGLLAEGKNVLGITLADGWYAGYMGLNNREWYGSRPRALLQLELTYQDGSRERICTDASWKASLGKIREADIFEGESWDALLEPDGWKLPGYDDSGWRRVDTGVEWPVHLTSSPGEPVVEHGRVRPGIEYREEGRLRLSFPEYVCGVLRLTARGERGSVLTVRYAEMLKEDGTLWLCGNRSARCQDSFRLKGEGEEEFFPHFTYHGFRYAELTVTGNAAVLEAEGVQIGSALLEPTEFTCSEEAVNRVFSMVKATEKANLFEVPTDCCARDERLGWGMEGNHFLCAMTWLNNLQGMARKWADDIFDGQREDGGLEAIAPAVVMKDVEPYIGDLQSHHGIQTVHTLYRMYGDRRTAARYYDALDRYFAFLDRNSDRYIRMATSCDWLGIWEDTGRSDTDHGYGECVPTIIGTAHYAINARRMQELSEALGKTGKAGEYRRLYENIRDAFQKHYVRRDGTLRHGKQGEYLIGLAAGLFPDEEKVMDVLAGKLTEKGYVRWLGGTPTTPYFLSTLKKHGREDLANQFLLSEQYPSIGYMAQKGFDTVWERWDAIDEEGKIHPQVMNAICHEGLAVVGGYLIEGLAGIESLEPGFRKIRIAPGVSPEIREVRASYQSIYGEISVDWKSENGSFSLEVRIPANTGARIELPSIGMPVLTEGTADSIQMEDGRAVLMVSSGLYRIRTETAPPSAKEA